MILRRASGRGRQAEGLAAELLGGDVPAERRVVGRGVGVGVTVGVEVGVGVRVGVGVGVKVGVSVGVGVKLALGTGEESCRGWRASAG